MNAFSGNFPQYSRARALHSYGQNSANYTKNLHLRSTPSKNLPLRLQPKGNFIKTLKKRTGWWLATKDRRFRSIIPSLLFLLPFVAKIKPSHREPLHSIAVPVVFSRNAIIAQNNAFTIQKQQRQWGLSPFSLPFSPPTATQPRPLKKRTG